MNRHDRETPPADRKWTQEQDVLKAGKPMPAPDLNDRKPVVSPGSKKNHGPE